MIDANATVISSYIKLKEIKATSSPLKSSYTYEN